MTTMANRVAGFGTTIFSEINDLALKHDAVNLGQGKPDFDGPPEIIAASQQALEDGKRNQYAPGLGIYSLRQAIAEHEQRFYGLDLDPDSQITVTVGATEGIFASVMGLVDPGDEVIVFEPFYDSYIPAVKMAGAIPRYCPLHPPTWHFDPDELRALFNEKTRALIINTPHNPTGKIYTDKELALIGDLCKEYDVTVISDEVYEHIIFDGIPHKSLIMLPDMFKRTVKVSSIGKSFSVTGWKIGWVVGSPELVTGVQRARQFISFAVAHPLQVGAAHALHMDDEYFESLIKLYQGKRDLLIKLLNDAGLKSATPQGSYFIMADFSDVFDGNDIEFAKWLIQEIGVACIPPTFFYSEPNKHIVSKQARFAFCKTDEVLHAAAEKLARMGN
ncbi:MAG: methionine aminotransferase [Chloroflexi bacterium]|nr:methionine aminotransferase [Chloroflexota bacterium]